MNAAAAQVRSGIASRTKAAFATPFRVGVVILVLTLVLVAVLVKKAPIMTALRGGHTITVEFPQDYQIKANQTKVKVAGLEAGVVSKVERTDHDTVLVSMKVDDGALDALGPEPSALLSPNTILGGQYSVELLRGGGAGRFEGTSIPLSRAKLPVELDRILESLPRDTRTSLQSLVKQTGRTLDANTQKSLRKFAAESPSTFRPAEKVFDGLQGTRPGTDLAEIVDDFDTTAKVLTQHDGQLAEILASLRDTTGAMARSSRSLSQGIDALPTTLRSTRSGMIDLQGTLDKLESTAESFRPSAKALDPLLRKLDPTLAAARPLLRDLRPTIRDARPLFDQLVPITRNGTAVLGSLRGPVLDRVNGPISDMVMNTWHGTGPYKESGGGMQADHKFYEELGYMVANLDRASMVQDAQGSLLNFQVGVNTGSVTGLPFTLPNLLKSMERVTGGTR